MPGTEQAGTAMRCPVLKSHGLVLRRCVMLRACYGMSGTELGYGATRWHRRRGTSGWRWCESHVRSRSLRLCT
eukprot:3535749-Rhodomonas_salina.2